MALSSTSTIAEINAALADGSVTHDEALAILEPRSLRLDAHGNPTKSALRASAWLSGKSAPKAPKAVKAPRKSGPGSRGGDPKRYAKGLYADLFVSKKDDLGAWWGFFHSAEAKFVASKVTTHADAPAVLSSLFPL